MAKVKRAALKKNKKQLFISLAAVVLVLGALAFMTPRGTDSSNNKVSGIVVNVIDRPNLAEDGYYGITLQDAAGKQYTIDATGYLNTPLTPESRGEACVQVPKVNVDDRVSFALPKIVGQDATFGICHDKSLTHYYFTVE